MSIVEYLYRYIVPTFNSVINIEKCVICNAIMWKWEQSFLWVLYYINSYHLSCIYYYVMEFYKQN